MNRFLSQPQYLIPIIFAILGYIVSLISSIIGSVGTTSIIIRPILSAIVMGGIGAGIIYFFQEDIHKIQSELVETDSTTTENTSEFVETDSTKNENITNTEVKNTDQSNNEVNDTDRSNKNEVKKPTETNQKTGFIPDPIPTRQNITASQHTKAPEGHIMVEGVPIKNEPRLMAEAIKHLLAKDDMDS